MDSTVGDSPVNEALAKLKSSLTSVIFFSLVINILMLVSPLYMLQVYDRVLVSASNSTLFFLTLIAIVALVLLSVFDAIRTIILQRIGTKFELDLAPSSFTKVVETGESSQPLRDIETIRSFVSSPALSAIMDAPWVPIYLGIIYLLHPWLGHLALTGAFILFVLALLSEKLTREPQELASNANGQAFRFIDVCTRQHFAIKSMAMTKGLLTSWQKSKQEGLGLSLLASQYSGNITAISKGLRLILQVGVLGLGAWLAIQQITTPGVMIAASIIMGRGLAPIEASISGWKLVIQARKSLADLRDFHQEDDIPEPLELPAPKGELVVSHLCFQYPEQEQHQLQDISLNINPGQVLGITGPNAAGKSTLGKMLIGLYKPSLGDIRLDGASYKQWQYNKLGPHIGYLPQDVELFPGTIAQNIARFCESEPEEVYQAAQLAGVHEMILALEDGYNHIVGNYGETISGGQRQRIALARAFFRLPKLILLDEPTSSLDAEAERIVCKAIRKIKAEGATIIVIGHRPAIMQATDQLLVLRNGQAALYGETSDVMSQVTRRISNE